MTDEIANVDDSEYEDAFNEMAGDASEDIEAPEPESNGGQESAGTDESEAEEPQEPDELTKLKEENQRLQHQFNSVNGRVSAYQRQAEQYKQQLEQRQQPQVGDNPQGSGMSDEKWEQLKEDYPDIAEAMESQLNGIRSQYEGELTRIKGEVEPLKQYQQQAQQELHISSQMQALESQHPDWRDVVQTDEYGQWLQTQPPSVQALMESTDAQDNIFLLNTFKATRAPQAPVQNPVISKRERQLRQSQTVPSRSTKGGQNDIADDDYEAAFNYYAEK
ncbi:hypothetical protein JC525_08955 [Alteromonas sp. IB21]|uniref:hypothetical protein n=1 Tax=Alteromonas sp. IB21 TaxID=2779369 RepID=UPI0018E80136|nr:hypothetical protein [Alteromonas sp. IB21]MBJ2129064.1 hypothetical protein [Alteromonas sp. IB21]